MFYNFGPRLTHECVSLSRKICGFCARQKGTRKFVPDDTNFLTGWYRFPVEIASDFFVGIHMHRHSRYM